MTKRKILIIEDDQEINRLIQLVLKKMEIDFVSAFSGTEGLLQIQNQAFDLIILDLMLPGLSGEDLMENVRHYSTIPIIVLSAKKDLVDKVQVLKNGADDYITKPFDEEELAARIEVQLRRNIQNNQGEKLIWREIQLDRDKLLVTIKKQEIQLTNSEFDILSLFLQKPGKALSKREIYEKIWKGVYIGDDNTISVHVSNLRRKIAEYTNEEYIKTVWGIGFILV